jgi:hypothetical protein
MTQRAALVVSVLAGLWVSPALSQPDCSAVEPYFFVLLDSSGSMNRSPVCSSADFSAGACSPLCPTGDCWLPKDGDDPSSKVFLAKKALFDALENTAGGRFGFATYNGDQLNVRAKHWRYRVDGNGPVVTAWGPFPAIGDREMFGTPWACGSGAGDSGVGCTASNPADLSDAWERERMLQWPKGVGLSSSVFFIRHASRTYQVTYLPVAGATPPSAGVAMTVRLERCLNATCTSRTLIANQTVSYSAPEELVSWALAPQRTEPGKDYFATSSAGQAVVTNSCAGWEPNDDATADSFSGYTLRHPTVSDLRGTAFSVGDQVPLDWLDDHRLTIQQRLAPNLLLGEPTANFATAPYLRDSAVSSLPFLHLRDERARPIVAVGSSPLAGTLHSFLTWFAGSGSTPGWRAVAVLEDPYWPCRSIHVVLVTDGDEGCSANPCTDAATLYSSHGIQTHVILFGGELTPGSKVPCIAYNGGTNEPILAPRGVDLETVLTTLFESFAVP